MDRSLEKTKIRQIGNGRGVLLSKSVCNLVGMDINDLFRVELVEGSLMLVPLRGDDS